MAPQAVRSHGGRNDAGLLAQGNQVKRAEIRRREEFRIRVGALSAPKRSGGAKIADAIAR